MNDGPSENATVYLELCRNRLSEVVFEEYDGFWFCDTISGEPFGPYPTLDQALEGPEDSPFGYLSLEVSRIVCNILSTDEILPYLFNGESGRDSYTIEINGAPYDVYGEAITRREVPPRQEDTD